MIKIVYQITQYLLGFLKRKNVDLTDLIPDITLERQKRKLEVELYVNYNVMSLLRMDIMRMQNDFIRSTKEPLMSAISNMENNEDKMLLGEDMREQLISINNKYNEHNNAMVVFEQSVAKLNEFKKINDVR
jgi:hypothetical protein